MFRLGLSWFVLSRFHLSRLRPGTKGNVSNHRVADLGGDYPDPTLEKLDPTFETG